MGNTCTKRIIDSEQTKPLKSPPGLSIQISKCKIDNYIHEKSSRISDEIADSELEDYLTDSKEHNDTIALAYLFSVI